MKYLVDLWMDGYDNDADLQKACLEFIKENLDFSASSVEAEPYDASLLSDMAAMLKRLEWSGFEYMNGILYDENRCPECNGRKEDGHKNDCPLAALLRRCEGKG